MSILTELRDSDFLPVLGIPWLSWWFGGSRLRYGQRRPHPGHRAWSWVPTGKYQPVSEYGYGTELVSRT